METNRTVDLYLPVMTHVMPAGNPAGLRCCCSSMAKCQPGKLFVLRKWIKIQCMFCLYNLRDLGLLPQQAVPASAAAVAVVGREGGEGWRGRRIWHRGSSMGEAYLVERRNIIMSLPATSFVLIFMQMINDVTRVTSRKSLGSVLDAIAELGERLFILNSLLHALPLPWQLLVRPSDVVVCPCHLLCRVCSCAQSILHFSARNNGAWLCYAAWDF